MESIPTNKIDRKIIKLFCVVGLNENKLTRYKEDETPSKYVQNIDIIQKNLNTQEKKFEQPNEKW
jgi:hypothetical protein